MGVKIMPKKKQEREKGKTSLVARWLVNPVHRHFINWIV